MSKPAFPSHGSVGEPVHSGMTLRQWYAGLALQGLLAAQGYNWRKDFVSSDVATAYGIADAMLAYAMLQERDK